ncbi:MAG TPA: TetR/AcrR family transcriptional regulator [Pseudonocardia sp.]|jgi:AcrR family transcriptional regulator|nr:TetR/AcrR family transcriptional regulator [Pseudonocardia sp.]
MPRLTRQESKARTRAALVKAARALFLCRGYQATSLEQVAEEADYSKGAVYSNFRGKEELCLAVLDDIHHREVGELVELLGAPTDFETALRGLDGWAERVLGSESWTVLGVEAVAAAHTSPGLRHKLAQRDEALVGQLAAALRRAVAAGRVTLTGTPVDVATILIGTGIGLGLQRAVNPAVRSGLLGQAARALIHPRVGASQPDPRTTTTAH